MYYTSTRRTQQKHRTTATTTTSSSSSSAAVFGIISNNPCYNRKRSSLSSSPRSVKGRHQLNIISPGVSVLSSAGTSKGDGDDNHMEFSNASALSSSQTATTTMTKMSTADTTPTTTAPTNNTTMADNHQQQQAQQQQHQAQHHQDDVIVHVPHGSSDDHDATDADVGGGVDFTCSTSTSHHIHDHHTHYRSEQIQSFYNNHCIYLLPMLGWFLFSGLLSLYNKYVFGDTHMAFPCPLLMTSVHFASQFLFSYVLTKTFPMTLGGDQVEAMSWFTFLSVAIPCGLVTSLDVGLSNLALVRITMTFYTMVKSSSPIFVVASAYVFGIEKITPALILTVLIISTGELLTVMGEVDFDLIGFILVLSASILSGMRWTVVQLKLQTLEPRLKSTLAVMRILSPLMFFSMIFLSFVLEKPWTRFGTHGSSNSNVNGANEISFFDTPRDALWTLGLGMIGATLAICMIICEFYLIMKSSAVVLMIGGVLKELTTIMIGVTVMGDQLNTVNSLGCVVVFSGVLLYKISHHLDNQKVYDTVDTMEDDGPTREGGGEVGGECITNGSGSNGSGRDGNALDAGAAVYGTINKRRKGTTRCTIVDHHQDGRSLVQGQGTDAELI